MTMETELAEVVSSPAGAGLTDAVAGPIWLLGNGLLAAAAWRVARALHPSDGFLGTLGTAVLLGWGGVVLTATALGLAGWLSGTGLLVGVAALSLLGFALSP